MSSGVKARLNSISIGISWFVERIVVWVSIVFFLVVGILSLFVTVYLPDYNYRVVFSLENWWTTAIIALAAIFLVSLLNYCNFLNRVNLQTILKILFFYTFILGLGWIALAHVWPEWDSYDTFFVARGLNNPSLMPDCSIPSDETWAACANGAMERYPYQLPLMFVFRMVNWIFGDGDYLAIEILNVFFTSFSFLLLGKLSHELFRDEKAVKITLLLCFFFVPQIIYVTFAYGNTLSLPFVLLALLFQCRSLREKKLNQGIASAFFIIVAILLKSTMIYVFMAMIVTWIVSLIKQFHWSELICIFLAVVFYVLSGFVIAGIGNQSGYETDKGLPKVVWIAMGLQRPQEAMPDNAGWYNGYPASWPADNYDPEQAKLDSMESIQNSLKSFEDDPWYAISFFSKKFLSEWTEPTYESLLASNWSSGRSDRPAMSDRPMSVVLHSMYYGKLHSIFSNICDVIQFLLLLGSAIALFFYRKQLTVYQINIVMIPFGMALLYLLWEAQSQYIMPAYIMMIPLAGAGLAVIGQWGSGVLGKVVERCQKMSTSK
ncbi:hypothetical protein BTIS_1352 [Bifidobacterium tissieri]|uniref:Uncharacterized protein n=1 Tax=Bifidobacterium tissieri TaxID=1630162 RepID=A0A261FEC8_9BIFI|nr:glycosyltransferase family 39 protein [Bifidobacterium tissieri]OZG57511.1 hypothetical protein BTIS_1352 [Bifidobacterium tissieri]